jgi:hypothetical protein
MSFTNIEETMKQNYFLTMDLDWCPDWILEKVLIGLEDVPLLIFMTNRSEFIESALQEGAQWSLGIHPNFEPKSSHGETPDEVFRFLIGLFPNSVAWRSHSLLSSNRVMQSASKISNLKITSNKYDPEFHLPTWTNNSFAQWRFLDLPIHFEDDLALVDDPDLERSAALLTLSEARYDLVTLSFHPIHIFLNSVDLEEYSKSKSEIYSNKELPNLPKVQNEYGIGRAFESFIESSPNILSEKEVLERFGLQ